MAPEHEDEAFKVSGTHFVTKLNGEEDGEALGKGTAPGTERDLDDLAFFRYWPKELEEL